MFSCRNLDLLYSIVHFLFSSCLHCGTSYLSLFLLPKLYSFKFLIKVKLYPFKATVCMLIYSGIKIPCSNHQEKLKYYSINTILFFEFGITQWGQCSKKSFSENDFFYWLTLVPNTSRNIDSV